MELAARAELERGEVDRERGPRVRTVAGRAGERSRTRTYDPLVKSQLLYRLSYAPACSRSRALSVAAQTSVISLVLAAWTPSSFFS